MSLIDSKQIENILARIKIEITEGSGGGASVPNPLPINMGGTGSQTADGARNNIGAAATSHTHDASNISSGTLPLTRGGTGVTSETDLRKRVTGYTDKIMQGSLPTDAETVGKRSVVIGKHNGTPDFDSTPNIIIGDNKGTLSDAYFVDNVIVGSNYATIPASSSWDCNIIIGDDWDLKVPSLSSNVFIAGFRPKITASEMTDNIVIGSGFDGCPGTISSSICIGDSAGDVTGNISDSLMISGGGHLASNIKYSFLIGGGKRSSISNCVFIGQDSGYTRNGSFADCIGIGNQAMYNASAKSYSKCIAIGSDSQVTGNNQNQIGSSGTTTYTYGSVQNRSDERDKANITNLDYDYKKFIAGLKPRNFQWDYRDDYRQPQPISNDAAIETLDEIDYKSLSDITHDGTHIRVRRHNGFIAQEVKSLMDSMGFDFAGYQDHKVNGGDDVLSLGYEEFIAPMVACIQDLMKENDALKQENKSLSDRISAIEQKLNV